MDPLEEEARKKALLDEQKNTESQTNKVGENQSVSGLGYIETTEQKQAKETIALREQGSQIGYRDVKVDILPTRGITLPINTRMSARPLTLAEIKHYSSMDEDEMFDLEEKTGNIFDNCIRIYFGDELRSWKDLPETDKVFMLFFLRDLTMQTHARDIKLFHTAIAPDNTKVKVEITNDIFAYNKIPNGIMKYYDESQRCFVIRDNGMEIFRFTIPTMGVIYHIKKYIVDKLKRQQNNEPNANYNKILFNRYAEWLIMDWRTINDDSMARLHQQFGVLSVEILDILDYLHKNFRYLVKPTIEMSYDGDKKFDSIVMFPRGISAIFNLSDISERLFED